MSDRKAWFLVYCPKCHAALHVELPPGRTSVACSEALPCKAVFVVHVWDAHMPPERELHPGRAESGAPAVPKAYQAYQQHMKQTMKELYAEHANAERTKELREQIFQTAAARWAGSQQNPKNAGGGGDAAGPSEEAMDTGEDAAPAAPHAAHESGAACPKCHKELVRTKSGGSLSCDMCSTGIRGSTFRYACVRCDHDVCERCWQGAPERRESRTRDAHA